MGRHLFPLVRHACVIAALGATLPRAEALAADTPTPSPAEIQQYFYRNGARALTVPSAGQPGGEAYTNGAALNTLPNPLFPAPRVPSAAAQTSPPPTASATPATTTTAPSPLPGSSVMTASPQPAAASSLSPPPLVAAPPLSESRAPESPNVSLSPPPAAPGISTAAAPAGTEPRSAPLRLVDDASSAVAPLWFVSRVLGGMTRVIGIAALMVVLSTVTLYALSLGMKRRTGRLKAAQDGRPSTLRKEH